MRCRRLCFGVQSLSAEKGGWNIVVNNISFLKEGALLKQLLPFLSLLDCTRMIYLEQQMLFEDLPPTCHVMYLTVVL